MGGGAGHALGHGLAVPARVLHFQAGGGAGITQGMSRKGNCIDNAATEQLFGHVKDEFYRGREWGSFEDFKRDLEGYIVHWNTRRRQVRLKGLTPEEFRNRALVA
mgnify:CR=1 FL=1